MKKALWFGESLHQPRYEGFAVQRCYRQSLTSSDLCSVSKFPWRGRKLPVRDSTRVFVYWAERLWYDWNHRCTLSLLCYAAGLSALTIPLANEQLRPASPTQPNRIKPFERAARRAWNVWIEKITCVGVRIRGCEIWIWRIIRLNAGEPSLFRSVRRVFLSSTFSFLSVIFRPGFLLTSGDGGMAMGGEACEEQSSHGL